MISDPNINPGCENLQAAGTERPFAKKVRMKKALGGN